MIIITAPVHPYFLNALSQKGYAYEYLPSITYAELEQRIAVAEGLVVTTRIKLDKNILSGAGKLKWIGRLGSGMELIDVNFAISKNIRCVSSPEGNKNAVAEHALGMLLNVLRNIHKSEKEIGEGKWLREPNRGVELSHKTVGIIGFGNTGSAFAKILSGFDVTILAYDKYKYDFGKANIKEASLQQVCKYSDVISFHLPLNSDTAHLCEESLFNMMETKPVIINTSRGEIVKLAHLLKALDAGIISGACLDVLENESLENMSDTEKTQLQQLVQHPKVIVTPHIAGYTQEAFLEMATVLLRKLDL